jgi:hypothetical protein
MKYDIKSDLGHKLTSLKIDIPGQSPIYRVPVIYEGFGCGGSMAVTSILQCDFDMIT